MSELDVLQTTLNHALDTLRAELILQGLPALSNYAQEPHPLDDPTYLTSTRLFEARRLALASLGQLNNLLQVPYEKVVEQTFAVYDTACLDVIVRTGIVDKLAQAPLGLPVFDLSTSLELDPVKITSILRYLAVQGWLYETSDNTFALTRSALELRKEQYGRIWALTPGKSKVAGSLLDMITHPQWKFSSSHVKTAFQLAHNTHLSVFEHLEQNPAELEQWSKSVRSHGSIYEHALLEDYPWHSLKPGVFVDCGAGQGFLSISLSKTLPESKFVVQDLPEVIPIPQANALREIPEAVKEERLIVEAHNFFEPQPRAADFYLFRHVLHNWSDEDCVKMLKLAAEAAKPGSKILIIEFIALPSTTSTKIPASRIATLDDLTDSPQYQAIVAPPFIPDNLGANAKMSLALGVHLLGAFNSRERSMLEWDKIISDAGLRTAHVQAVRANVSVIECDVI